MRRFLYALALAAAVSSPALADPPFQAQALGAALQAAIATAAAADAKVAALQAEIAALTEKCGKPCAPPPSK